MDLGWGVPSPEGGALQHSIDRGSWLHRPPPQRDIQGVLGRGPDCMDGGWGFSPPLSWIGLYELKLWGFLLGYIGSYGPGL